MKYGLSDKELSGIINVLSSFPQIESAILYGSRAKGTFKLASDIDLTLKGPDLTSMLLPEIQWALDELYLPYKVDLSIFENISNEDLINHIGRVGVAIYAKS